MMLKNAATALAVAAALHGAPALAAPPTIEQQIQHLEDGVNGAYAANDLPKYFSYYADDLRALYPEGPTNLPDYIKSWTKFIHDGGRIEHFAVLGMKIQVSPAGDAAVASYQAEAQQRNADKSVETDKFDETDVWFKRGGTWKIAEIQYAATRAGK